MVSTTDSTARATRTSNSVRPLTAPFLMEQQSSLLDVCMAASMETLKKSRQLDIPF